VIVSEDIAVMTDDEPGAEALLFELTLGHISEKPLKEIIPAEMTERRPLTEGGAESAAPHRLGRADVHDGGFEFFGQIREGEGRAREIAGCNGRHRLDIRSGSRRCKGGAEHLNDRNDEKTDQKCQEKHDEGFSTLVFRFHCLPPDGSLLFFLNAVVPILMASYKVEDVTLNFPKGEDNSSIILYYYSRHIGDKRDLSMTKPEISDFLREHPYWSYQKKPLTVLGFPFYFQGRFTFCHTVPCDS